MAWEIVAWAAVVLLMVFRLALVVGIVALGVAIVRRIREPQRPVTHAGVPARK